MIIKKEIVLFKFEQIILFFLYLLLYKNFIFIKKIKYNIIYFIYNLFFYNL